MVVTKEDQGAVDVLVFVVVIEAEVFVEQVKTMVAVLPKESIWKYTQT